MQGQEIGLGADYGTPKGRVQIGIRPEFAVLDDTGGLPFALHRVEDVGRHRILRGEVAGAAFNIIAPDGTAIVADLTHVTFAPQKISVYVDDWRIQGRAD